MTVFILSLGVLALGIGAVSLMVLVKKNHSFSRFSVGHNPHMHKREIKCPKEEEKLLHKKKKMGIVAIVGRPNVGKSTLFNRLAGRRQAIVDPVSGVTRDRHYGKTDWNGREFSIIDTGGYAEKSGDFFEEQIQRQVLIAIEQADVVLFVVDVQTGITDYDLTIADLLRKSGKKS